MIDEPQRRPVFAKLRRGMRNGAPSITLPSLSCSTAYLLRDLIDDFPDLFGGLLNLANRLITIIAPKIIGKGIEAVGDLQIRDLTSAKQLSVQKIRRIGADILIDRRLG